jgi:hypothetical protein
MRKFILLSFLIALTCTLWSQTSRRAVVPLAERAAIGRTSSVAALPFSGLDPFFTYFFEWPEGELEVQIRFSTDAEKWTPWQPMARDDHSVDKGSTLLYVGDPAHRYYQLQVAGALAAANLHFYYPGTTVAAAAEEATGEARDLLGCPCPQPEYQTRSQWCPSDNCPIRGTPVTTAVTHLIVHHTAGPNELSDWAAYMRSVWDFHVNGRGWDDIGYNWLIDPNGVIYQGRGDNIRGAHFCSSNTGTMGVAMMGDYTDREPSSAALLALRHLLAWKSCDRDFDPQEVAFHPSSGRNLRRVSGHRDGCDTACPGDQFYPLFGQVRQGVADYIENSCDVVGETDIQLPSASIQVVPNPITDQTSIRLLTDSEGEVQLELVNAVGQLVHRQRSHKYAAAWTASHDWTHLPQGIYFLRVRIGNQYGVQRILKSE